MKREYNFYLYIMASKSGTLYIGFSNSLQRRAAEHKEGKIDGFTKKYVCNKLVYYERFIDVYAAITRAKEVKKWNRSKKEKLIFKMNPHWNDLSDDLFN